MSDLKKDIEGLARDILIKMQENSDNKYINAEVLVKKAFEIATLFYEKNKL